MATGRLFSPGTLFSSTNKTDYHNIPEILLNVALNTITLTCVFITLIKFTYIKQLFVLLIKMNQCIDFKFTWTKGSSEILSSLWSLSFSSSSKLLPWNIYILIFFTETTGANFDSLKSFFSIRIKRPKRKCAAYVLWTDFT